MYLLTSLILIALAFEALSLSEAFGAESLPRASKTVSVPLIYSVFQALMICAGFYLTDLIVREENESLLVWVAFVLLIFFGGKMVFESVRSMRVNEKTPARTDIGYGGIAMRCVSPAIDGLAVGISLTAVEGVAAENCWVIAGVMGGAVLVLSYVGVLLGERFGERIKNRAHVFKLIGGVILIVVAVICAVNGAVVEE